MILLIVLIASTRALAEPAASILSNQPIDQRIQIDAMLGLGSEHLNLGLGVRGGKTYGNHFYLGGAGVYHLGTSNSAMVNGVTATSSVSGFYLGGEAGYAMRLAAAPIVIRPYVGLGLASASGSTSAGGASASSSSSELALWPGVVAHYHLQDSKFELGGDLRFVTGPWGTSIGLFVIGSTYL